MRAYYSRSLSSFLQDSSNTIFGEITSNDSFASEELQKNAWKEQINILKRELRMFGDGHLLFEYTIPRIGKRIDNVFIYKNIIFLLEFKIGEATYPAKAKRQTIDYALDLKAFHEESKDKLIVPILICTKATNNPMEMTTMRDCILELYCCNETGIGLYIDAVCKNFNRPSFEADNWINSRYKPSPTIIEAAKALYLGHNVKEISRSDASAKNLNQTTKEINKIIEHSKKNSRKSICFVTGVPGAGKTLAGLNIAVERQRADADEHAVFLSGNGPLVMVLQEALARDDEKRNKVEKSAALTKAKEFIQNIHRFRDDAFSGDMPPIEKVTVFDEAQRAWDEKTLSGYMWKKGKTNFDMSEPDFLISYLNRHQDWATIICLVGGGQEINKGESAGIKGWFEALKANYRDWDVYVSDIICEEEYSKGLSYDELTDGLKVKVSNNLHLSVSLRSFRNEKVSQFVKALLDVDEERAKTLYQEFKLDYPIYITRDIEKAKHWVRTIAKGSERYGIMASSKARRLRKYGIWVADKIDAPKWFLNDSDDVRASCYLEETATEFDVQGLELDWAVVCWDADFRMGNRQFQQYIFRGTRWNRNKDERKRLYQKNAYRVLLTRARQGFVIFIPEGDSKDKYSIPKFYNGTYQYLKDIGIEEL